MNLGVIMLIGYLVYRSYGKQQAGTAAANTATVQFPWRTITVSVLTFSVFFAGVFLQLEWLQPYIDRIGSSFLRDVAPVTVYFLFPILVLRCGLPWFAWRVCRHLRHPLPARFVFWFTPGERRAALAGFARLVAASCGRHPVSAQPHRSALRKKLREFFLLEDEGARVEVDAWTVAALAVHAAVCGNARQAERYLDSFDQLRRVQIPGLVRVFAFEWLALHAAKRGDWWSVARLARFGTGRSTLLIRELAAAHLSGRARRPLLLLGWIVAPCRIATFPLLRGLLQAEAVASAAEASAQSFQVEHLRLLRDAAEGREIGLATVLSLASAWQEKLTAESQAELLARGMVVEARDAQGAVAAISETLLAQLEELAAGGVGLMPMEVWENWEEWQDTLVGTVVLRLRNRLFVQLEEAALRFHGDDDEEVPPLLQCWEHWLALRDATERLGTLMGKDDVATAWYGGLRDQAWNGACRVFNTYGKQSAWVSHLMFGWVATVAEKLGDEEAAEVNRRNVDVCGIPVRSTFEALVLLARRVSDGLLRACSVSWWQSAARGFAGKLRAALLERITIVLPVGGTIVIVTVLSSIWSFSDVFVGSLLGLPAVLVGVAVLYLLALRIEKRGERAASPGSEGQPPH